MWWLVACADSQFLWEGWRATPKTESTATFDDHEYRFVTTPEIWADAQLDCQSTGHHLLDLADEAELLWVWALADVAEPADAWWHGCNDQGVEGTFVWDGGSSSTFTQWRTGEPNDFGSAEDCATLADNGGGAWNDKDCSQLHPYVCESGCEKSYWYADIDADGYGDPATAERACVGDTGTVENGADCDDGDADVNPEGFEVCGGSDEDCDGLVDDADDSVDPSELSTFFVDADGDGYGSATGGVQRCASGEGYAENDLDCDDTRADRHPGATETADGIDNDCDGTGDSDGDGYETSLDCDDADASVSPAAVEACDAIDQDCDGILDNDAVCPGAIDHFDDHAYVFVSTNASWETAQLACATFGYHLLDLRDATETAWVWAAAESVNPTSPWWQGYNDRTIEGTFIWDGGSLSSFANWRSGEPNDFAGAEDCATLADDGGGAWNDKDCALEYPYICEAGCEKSAWYTDSDGDGYGASATELLACEAPIDSVALGDDCDDANAAVFPGAAEACDDFDTDEDCNGTADDADETFDPAEKPFWYPDHDGDGVGTDALSVQACEQPEGFVAKGGDCDDDDPAKYPGAPQEIDGYDADCDGVVEAFDSDGDGLLDTTESTLGTDPHLADSDGDTLSDGSETPNPEAAPDTDGDSLIDPLDDDDDGDGLPTESELASPGESRDTDGDQAADHLDENSDNDGLTDAEEGTRDTDSDGIPDRIDVDDDGDGRDSILEGLDDPDDDGVPNALDRDSDGDGCADADEPDDAWLVPDGCEEETGVLREDTSEAPTDTGTSTEPECGCGTPGSAAGWLLLPVLMAGVRTRSRRTG